ncbi:MAG: biotin synthase BioB [Duncaniella sp.]|nr:biotin synthase BioB [Duncaniella sp.]MDE6572875.1 biotin synthase BioB [Duncaniella sp.]
MNIAYIKEKVMRGEEITPSEALSLASDECDLSSLLDAAAEVTSHFGSRKFDSCSIINARSGLCPENCKWCAQSAHYATGAATYPLVSHEVCMTMGRMNREAGIGRFSLVTSGRAVTGKTLDTICSYYRELKEQGGMGLCASMGLLTLEALRKLREAGVERYHCNLETAPSHFGSLCSTHTIDDKIATIRAAREAGMEICSGGIIGMGESMEQRVEFALKLREIHPASIPINVLQPIPGTPLEKMKPLTDDEILRTVAIFRMVHPKAVLRFAGGRARISPQAQREALRVGINGAIMGDLLTTVGATIEEDKRMIKEAGYEF